jgi:hypothetical protein
LIAWLKANPNRASAGVAGVTSVGTRLLTTFFQKETGTQFALIPYRGGPNGLPLNAPPAQIDLFFETPLQLPLMRTTGPGCGGPAESCTAANGPWLPGTSIMTLQFGWLTGGASVSTVIGLFEPG